MSTVTRAIGYVRTGKTDRAAVGAQRRKIRAHAKAAGLELVDVVTETGSAAVRQGELSSIEHRPILEGLLDRARAAEYDVLLVAGFDRLGSDEADRALLARWFAHYRVSLVSTSAGALEVDTAQATLIDRILAATDWQGVHRLERRRFLERVQAGKAAGKKQGRHVQGRLPFGYRTAGGELVPDPRTAPVVRRIFEAVREGRSLGRIARDLNTDGIAGPQPARGNGGRASSWKAGTVSRIVTNPVYAGERYGVKRAHAAIVTRQAFNAAQTRLDARRRAPRAAGEPSS